MLYRSTIPPEIFLGRWMKIHRPPPRGPALTGHCSPVNLVAQVLRWGPRHVKIAQDCWELHRSKVQNIDRRSKLQVRKQAHERAIPTSQGTTRRRRGAHCCHPTDLVSQRWLLGIYPMKCSMCNHTAGTSIHHTCSHNYKLFVCLAQSPYRDSKRFSRLCC